MKLAGIELPPPMAEAVRACRPHFVAAAVFSFFINLLFLAPALYMLQVYDRVVTTGGKTTLLFITIALAIALAALASFDAIRSRLLVRASLRLDALLAPRILKRMMGKDSARANQAMRDFDTVRQTVASPVAAAVFDAPWSPLFLLVCFLLHFWIGVLALVAMVVLMSLAWRNQQATTEATQIGSEAMAASHGASQAIAMNSDTVRALGMTGRLVDRLLGQRGVGLTRLAHAQFTGSRFSSLSRLLRLFVQSAALGLGALLAIAGYISVGAIIAASILVSRALQPVEALIGGWSSISGARAALQRLTAVFEGDEAPRIHTLLPRPQGHLQLEHVGVRGSDGRPILYDVSFEVRPGEMLGVVGPSGSGKTTLAKVIAGATIPAAGTVRIDGAQLSDWDQDELARYVGYVPQEPSLFEGTIKENISRFASVGEDGSEVDALAVAAAKRAGAHNMILKLPQGYDSRLGPLGAGLSAGQAQRVALARALYGSPVLLILDEANAFLDGEGEEALLAAIADAIRRKMGVIMIAHRKSVLQHAQRLLVLEGGRLRMIGPSAEVARKLAAPVSEKAL
jgi:PrtD family type I secretion system ABC transporter